MSQQFERAILLLSCPDRKGIVAHVSNFISNYNGNILDFDQHTNEGVYFMRVEWSLSEFGIASDSIEAEFQHIAQTFRMDFRLELVPRTMRIALFVSGYDHCLYDIILKHREYNKEYNSEIRCMISNHSKMGEIAKTFNIPFYYFDMNNKPLAEAEQIKILQNEEISLIVLARYMQILSPHFVSLYPNKIINIHHSFLPAFKGARPYHQAYERGVKIIGASSHYVTEDLDQGPLIAQDTVRVSHRDSVQKLVAKGRDLERRVLNEAVKLHLEHRILSFGNKTIIFG